MTKKKNILLKKKNLKIKRRKIKKTRKKNIKNLDPALALAQDLHLQILQNPLNQKKNHIVKKISPLIGLMLKENLKIMCHKHLKIITKNHNLKVMNKKPKKL